MDFLTYTCPRELEAVTAKAAAVWNEVMRDLVHIRKWEPMPPGITWTPWQPRPNITVELSDKLRTPEHPQRIGNCARIAPDTWLIRLDSLRKWAISPWSRFWGNGQDALAALVHEVGHVFNLPHASDPGFVMHTAIGGNGKLSKREKDHYRQLFLNLLESEK